ncbi:hypothetical protein D9M70_400980 [compost metagenome]
MISRKLMVLLLATAVLAWFTSGRQSGSPATGNPAPATRPAEAEQPADHAGSSVAGEPWRRSILLPAIEPLEPPEPQPALEPPPLPPVEPAPPAQPSAPPLPVTYLGRLTAHPAVILYVRYQDRPVGLKSGERLGDDYRLESVAKDHAMFRYLPLDTLQELRWHGQP